MTEEMLTSQDEAIKAFQKAIGVEEFGGAYGLVNGVFWFYCCYGDGCVDCYPASESDMAEAIYPTLVV